MLIGSARVSKADGFRSLNLQRDALRAEGVGTTFDPPATRVGNMSCEQESIERF